MKSLFRRPRWAKRLYTVENLNPSKGISSSMRLLEKTQEYKVCLFLPEKTTENTYPDRASALEQMRKYRALYKQIQVK